MKFRIALAATAAVLAAGSAASAATVTANAVANANIVAPAAVTSIRSLEFGTIAKPTSTSNTITVPSAASASVTPTISGTGNAFIPTGGQARAATFRLIGTANQAIAVNTSTLSFTNEAGNLSSVQPLAPSPSTGSLTQLPASGTDDFFVGGRFDISPTTAVQAYTGTVSLSIDFN